MEGSVAMTVCAITSRPAALRTTLQYRGYIQTAVAAKFVSYSVQAYTKSLPTPSSGATTGADYYISVSSALSQPFSFAAINSIPKWFPPSYGVSPYACTQ